jgi:hypothetical protein
MMKRFGSIALLLGMVSTALAAKYTAPATLRDVQPTNAPAVDKHHQQFDLFLATASSTYTCRTPAEKSMNATDFVVGSPVTFVFSGKNGEVKTSAGKKAKCLIVRVESGGVR